MSVSMLLVLWGVARAGDVFGDDELGTCDPDAAVEDDCGEAGGEASGSRASEGAAWQPSAAQQALYDALKVRDPVPSCGQLAELSSDPADLLALVDHVASPPWVGMRAAECLITDHAEAVRDQLVAWVGPGGQKGLALLVLGKLDAMPQPVGLAVARAGLAGPYAKRAAEKVARSGDPQIRALGGE